MIVFETSPTPAVRAGEFEIASRRIAARAFPYAGEVGGARFRFDPIERRFFARSESGTVLAGPHDPQAWRTAFLKGHAGPALVGPGNPGEAVHGAYLAAAEGARQSGRAVYLLDPDSSGLPQPPGRSFTALLCWFPGLPDGSEILAEARARGIAAGRILPLVPGWTATRQFAREAARLAAAAGATFLSGVALTDDGVARRLALDAAAAGSPEAAEELFDGVHHGSPSGELAEAEEALREACGEAGLSSAPPRPIGSREPAANAAAAARLEEMAREAAADEHRAALFHAAARWLDESGRDLAAVAREGNLPKVFPYGAELARDVEKALLAAAP